MNFDIFCIKEFIDIIRENHEFFDKLIDHKYDFMIDYFGFYTLARAYLMSKDKEIIERPQYMLLRCAIQIHKNNLEVRFQKCEVK